MELPMEYAALARASRTTATVVPSYSAYCAAGFSISSCQPPPSTHGSGRKGAWGPARSLIPNGYSIEGYIYIYIPSSIDISSTSKEEWRYPLVLEAHRES